MNGRIGLIYALIVFVVWGVATFWDKLAVNKLGGNTAATMAALVWVPSLIIVLVIAFFSHRLGLNAEGVKWFFLSNLAWAAASALYYLVLSKMELGMGATITALYPVVAVILGIVFLGEEMTVTKILGVILGIGAMILLSV